MKVLITEKEIEKKVTEIANQIMEEYEGKEITLICILKGSMFFTVNIARKIKNDLKIDFIQVSSYGNETTSSGQVELKLDLKDSIENKEVIIVEDIIDTGRTLSYLIKFLKARNPKSLKLCALLDKVERREIDVKVDYTGFTIPNKFIVGYGLDCDEKYRNLSYIGYFEE